MQGKVGRHNFAAAPAPANARRKGAFIEALLSEDSPSQAATAGGDGLAASAADYDSADEEESLLPKTKTDKRTPSETLKIWKRDEHSIPNVQEEVPFQFVRGSTAEVDAASDQRIAAARAERADQQGDAPQPPKKTSPAGAKPLATPPQHQVVK